MTPNTDRKARRIARIRGEIMDAAVCIIAEKGFNNATTKEIAKKADMAEGTLYNYFKNKDDILMSIAERYVTRKQNVNVSTDVSSVQEFIMEFYASSLSNLRENYKQERQVLKALLPEFLTNKKLGKLYFDRIVYPFFETIEPKLKELQEKGLVDDFDVKTLSRMLYSPLIGFAILEINNDPIVSNATPEFKNEARRAYVEVFGKGMSKSEA